MNLIRAGVASLFLGFASLAVPAFAGPIMYVGDKMQFPENYKTDERLILAATCPFSIFGLYIGHDYNLLKFVPGNEKISWIKVTDLHQSNPSLGTAYFRGGEPVSFDEWEFSFVAKDRLLLGSIEEKPLDDKFLIPRECDVAVVFKLK